MHNCRTAHPKQSHRRRNRFLRKALEPLRWWEDERAKTGEWGHGEAALEGTGVFQKGIIETIGSVFSSRPSGSPAPERVTSGDRVQVYRPSALRRLAANARRFMPFTSRRSG